VFSRIFGGLEFTINVPVNVPPANGKYDDDDDNDKLPLLSILNWDELYFKVIVSDVFKNGLLKVKLFCLFDNVVFIVFNDPST